MVRYEFVTGEVIEVEVSEEIGEVIFELERAEFNVNRKETRRHSSLERLEELGFQFRDESVNVEETVVMRDEARALTLAIEKLPPKQGELVRKIYFEETSQIVIAREEGVNRSSIHRRLERIHEHLKKLL